MKARSAKVGDRVIYHNYPNTVYTITVEADVAGFASATYVDANGDLRNSKINLNRRYEFYREPHREAWTADEMRAQASGAQLMTNHLYRNPRHTVLVANTGMPAEFILAVCQDPDCKWETQW